MRRPLALGHHLVRVAACSSDRARSTTSARRGSSRVPPKVGSDLCKVAEPSRPTLRLTTNYIVERDARNQSLGATGELFVLNYERARLIRSGKESLAARIEHTSKVQGDCEGYDILAFDDSSADRLIEVKTTGGDCAARFE